MIKILKKIGGVLSGALIAIELVAVIFIVFMRIGGDVPTIFGHNLYVIVSPSMEPEICVGDIIISKEYKGEMLEKDQVITYRGREGDLAGKIITHKVVNVSQDGETIVTRGVANGSDDPAIGKSDVMSVMVYKTFLIGKIYSVISTVWGFILLVLTPMLALIVSEVVNLLKDIKAEKESYNDGNGIEEQEENK